MKVDRNGQPKPFAAYEGSEPYIFVSYAHQDSDVVYLEISWLKDQGFNLWYDEGISPGSEWHQELADRIDGSSLFVYFITPHSVASDHCQREVHYAIDNGSRILAVHLDETVLPGGVNLSLSSMQAILRFEQTELDYRIKLLRGVSDHIQRGIAESTGVDVPGKKNVFSFLRSSWLLASIFSGCLLLVVAGLWPYTRTNTPMPDTTVLRAELSMPGVQILHVTYGNIALSPDALKLAYIGISQDRALLYVRELDTGRVSQLPGTDHARYPFWSPDNKHIAFFDEEKLKKTVASGGPVQVIADATDGRGGSWSPNGTIVFAPDIGGALYRVSAGGGEVQPVTEVNDADTSHRNPYFLSDGERFVFTTRDTTRMATGSIALGSLSGEETRIVMEDASNPQVAGGQLFYVRDTNLLVQPFTPDMRAIGGPIALAERIEYYNPRDIGNYSVSQQKTLVYRLQLNSRSRLAWLDFDGNELSALSEWEFDRPLAIDRQATQVVLGRTDANLNGDLWIHDLIGNQSTRVTFRPSQYGAAFSPDGKQLAVSSRIGRGKPEVWIQAIADGTIVSSLDVGGEFQVSGWSKDGRFLIGERQMAKTGWDVVYVDLDLKDGIHDLVTTTANDWKPRLSPNGAWLAYGSDETSRSEIYITDFPAGKRKLQLTNAGGRTPWWNDDGQKLYFVSPNGVSSLSITTGDIAGAPTIGPVQHISNIIKFSSFNFPIRVEKDRLMAMVPEFDNYQEPIRIIKNWQKLVTEQE